MCFCYIITSPLYLQIFYSVRHVALCFYSSTEQTNQTLALERGLSCFLRFWHATVKEGETRGVQLFAICNLTARCQEILHNGLFSDRTRCWKIITESTDINPVTVSIKAVYEWVRKSRNIHSDSKRTHLQPFNVRGSI